MATLGLTLPATKGKQGRRTFFVVTVPNSVLNNFFTVNMDPPEEASQRQLDPKHAHDIRDYLIANPDDYVLPTLVYAIDREPDYLASALSESVGVITIPFGTNLRSLDGQHRRQGLNEAIERRSLFAEDMTSVLLYVEPSVVSRRQMFSDMNATPKVVSKAQNVIFNNRSPFSRAANELSRRHHLLAGRVEMHKASIPASSPFFYTVSAVEDVLKRLQVGLAGRVRSPQSFHQDSIQERGAAFFDVLHRVRPEFDAVMSGRADLMELRNASIIFSGTTLRVLAGAVFLAALADGRHGRVDAVADGIRSIDFTPNATLWQSTGFVSPGKSTPSARNQEILAATREVARLL